MDIAQEMLPMFNDDPDMLKKVIISDVVKTKHNHSNENRFATTEEIKKKSKQELLAISKSAFQKCFEDWKNAGIGVYSPWSSM